MQSMFLRGMQTVPVLATATGSCGSALKSCHTAAVEQETRAVSHITQQDPDFSTKNKLHINIRCTLQRQIPVGAAHLCAAGQGGQSPRLARGSGRQTLPTKATWQQA